MEKIVRVGAGIMLMKEGKILLGKRVEACGSAPSTWTMPGGKVEFGESLEEAVIRETFEETGLSIKNPKFICVVEDCAYGSHFVTAGFFSEEFEGNLETKEPDKIASWQWFDLNSLPEPIFVPSLEVIENYKRGEVYFPRKI